MGMYDIFVDKETNKSEQLKCFHNELKVYNSGDILPLKEFGFPDNCTFAAWGGNEKSPYYDINLLGIEERMGNFVVIKDSKLLKITTDLNLIIKPVYGKYGDLLKEKETINE